MVYEEKIYPKILVLGDGLLGSEIIKQTGWDYLSHKKDDIDVLDKYDTFIEKLLDIKPDIIINCIGYTDTYNNEKQLHWDLNYLFVVNLSNFCNTNDIKLVISQQIIYMQIVRGITLKKTFLFIKKLGMVILNYYQMHMFN